MVVSRAAKLKMQGGEEIIYDQNFMKGLRNGNVEHSWEVHLGCGRVTSFAEVEGKEMKVVDSDLFGVGE